MVRFSHLLAVLILGSLPLASQAAKVKVWHQQKPGDFEKARFQQIVVSTEGVLRLSRQFKPLTAFSGSTPGYIWDLAEDRAGNLYVATDLGKIFKISPQGKTTVAYSAEDQQILCLTTAPDGSIYAGTGPAGRVIHLDPQGQARQLCEGLGSYVWSLAVDPRGENLYAGTGPKGVLYKITSAGKATVFYKSKQDHLLCVALGPDGQIYTGTDKNGLVYRLDSKGKAFVLYQAPQAEIRTLLVNDDGLYVGTSSPTKGGKRSTSSFTGAESLSASSGQSRADMVLTAQAKNTKKRLAEESRREPDRSTAAEASKASSESSKDEEKKGTAASAPSEPSAGENSIYHIATDGTVREIFREKVMVLSMLRQNKRLFVGTGMDGQLFEVNETTRETSEIARLDHGQILSLLRRADGSIVVATGNPGKLYVLEDRFATRGTLTSEVHDAKLISKWGSLRWQAETPEGTTLTIAVRTGNVAEPDETWSEWSAEQSDREKAIIAATTARFVQYRVTMTSTVANKTPALRGVTLRYMNTNQAPEITRVEVPNLDATNLENPKKLKFKWSATDANEDEVTYSLFVRKDGWKNWVQLEDDLDKTEYEWDTTTTPSGIYQLKVVASDRKDNPEGDALSGSRISVPFVVSHTPPTVEIKASTIEDGRVVLEATATSPLARITAASYALNGKKWVNVFPTDELFDSKSERFKFKTQALKPGTYVVVLRVRDAAGNTGSSDVVFTVQPRP